MFSSWRGDSIGSSEAYPFHPLGNQTIHLQYGLFNQFGIWRVVLKQHKRGRNTKSQYLPCASTMNLRPRVGNKAVTSRKQKADESGKPIKFLETNNVAPLFCVPMGNKLGRLELKGGKSSSEHLIKAITTISNLNPEKDGYRVELDNNNVYKWNVHLFDFPKDAPIKYGII